VGCPLGLAYTVQLVAEALDIVKRIEYNHGLCTQALVNGGLESGAGELFTRSILMSERNEIIFV
jgi:hypothetical protein